MRQSQQPIECSFHQIFHKGHGNALCTPESESNLPNIAPSPKTSAKCPSVPPNPASMVLKIFSGGIPSAKATPTDTMINEIKVFNLKRIISKSNAKIPIATMTNGIVVPLILAVFVFIPLFVGSKAPPPRDLDRSEAWEITDESFTLLNFFDNLQFVYNHLLTPLIG